MTTTRLFSTIFLLLYFTSLFAQDEPPFRFGIRGGGNLYSGVLSVAPEISKKLHAGYQIGLTAEYEFRDNVYLQTEVGLTTKGVVYKGSEVLEGGVRQWTQNFTLRDVEVPFLIAYKPEIEENISLYFHGGPYFAYGIGGKTRLKITHKQAEGEDVDTSQDSFGENGFKKLDIGIRFGSGLEFEKYTIGFDFEYGLTNISRKDTKLSSLLNDRGFKNKGVCLSLGYKF